MFSSFNADIARAFIDRFTRFAVRLSLLDLVIS